MTADRDRLLGLLQDALPLLREPFAELDARLGTRPGWTRQAVAQLRREGLLRRIGGVFDPARLGFAQALVALAVPPEQLESAGAVVADHPGVSHAYQRSNDRYRLWFTLAVSPSSELGLAGTAQRLATLAKARAHLLLPTRKRYKLHVRFASSSASPPTCLDQPPPTQPAGLTELHRRALPALQASLPVEPDPFARLGARFGLDAEELLVAAADLLAAGVLRRYAAILDHRRAGASENILAVWAVDDDRADAAGRLVAAEPAVSHAYLRPAGADWPYTLYTMLHGPSREDCLAKLDRLADRLDHPPRKDLWTLREFHKHPADLLGRAEADWEHGHTA